jgi:tetratricopeptide (TPR) repeat protein
LQNNPFDVHATMSLAELDIEVGTGEAYRTAEKRLTAMLEWMPENADGWVNLGVVHRASGRTSKAIEAYRQALSQDPRHATAALNLAVIYEELGETAKAAPLFARAAESGLESIAELSAVHDFYAAKGRTLRLVDLWDEFLGRHPDSVDGQAFRAWSRALAGDLTQAKLDAEVLCSAPLAPPLAQATLAFIALIEQQYSGAARQTDLLCATGPPGADARQRLMRRLEMLGQQRPGLAWTYCLASELLIADGQPESARLGVELCDQRCMDRECRERVTSLRARLSGAPASPTAPSGDTP